MTLEELIAIILFGTALGLLISFILINKKNKKIKKMLQDKVDKEKELEDKKNSQINHTQLSEGSGYPKKGEVPNKGKRPISPPLPLIPEYMQ